MGNSGEYTKPVNCVSGADWMLHPMWNFTVCSTLKQNGLVEVEFATIARRARAMCNEILIYSTVLGNLVMDKDGTQFHYQLIGIQNIKWMDPGVMQTFEEAGIVTHGKNGKLGDWGIPMMFVGYAKNHSSDDCYRMWIPDS